jgi:D-alanyl-lipoteichoic acid acyltransferase DltB (MBOAT superfamily)
MKFGSMKTETIVKGIMICTALILLYRLIPFFNFLIPLGTEITPTIGIILNIRFYLVMIGSLIIELVLLRLFCEVIYNLVAAAKCIISDKEKHEQNL